MGEVLGSMAAQREKAWACTESAESNPNESAHFRSATAMICVVIPYFQAEAGILRRALASVAAQKNCLRQVHVMVIDDASPAPAGPEQL